MRSEGCFSTIFKHISRRFFFTTTYLSIFKEMGDHDNNLSILLPNHFPKSRKSSLNGTLSGNVSPRLAESIHKVGIQVVILVFISFWPQSNASVIIWKKVVNVEVVVLSRVAKSFGFWVEVKIRYKKRGNLLDCSLTLTTSDFKIPWHFSLMSSKTIWFGPFSVISSELCIKRATQYTHTEIIMLKKVQNYLGTILIVIL